MVEMAETGGTEIGEMPETAEMGGIGLKLDCQ